jgi:(2Fe-2S) ferredoxin
LKAEVAVRRQHVEIWVTKTHCLGICPKRGATVARYPSAAPIVADVELGDVDALLSGERADPRLTRAEGEE